MTTLAKNNRRHTQPKTKPRRAAKRRRDDSHDLMALIDREEAEMDAEIDRIVSGNHREPPSGLRAAAKGLAKAVGGAEKSEAKVNLLASDLERTQSDLSRIRRGLSTEVALDRESFAAQGRRFRDTESALKPALAEAQADLQRLTAIVQNQAAKLAGELAKLAKARFERAVLDAQEALSPWCQPETSARLAQQTDFANECRARTMQSHFCPNASAGRQLLAEAERTLRDA